MSTTLTNGLKLPDKGSVDWYADMQNNYTILDGAVGTIADHTTAIAGKAASSHTHTKSDVTDLLNSNFIPSANNSYDLGSSSYQWNNLYAKNYYYNGVAWGLDKDNEWTREQTYSTGSYGQMIWLKNTDLDLSVNGNTGLSGTYQQIIKWVDKNKTTYSMIQSWTNSSENVLVLRSYYRTNANTVRESSVRNLCSANAKIWYPESDADTDLGTSTNKWKSFNGVNPGALSLPTLNYTDTSKYMDISGGLSTTGSDNWYTPVVDGWIFMIINNSPTFANILVFVTPNGTTPAKFIAGAGGVLESSTNAMWCGCPAPAGSRVRIRIKNGTIEQAVFVTCQGNV